MFFVFSNLTGLLVGNSTQRSSYDDREDLTVFDLDTDPGSVYMNNDGVLVSLPEKPGRLYMFNRNTQQWVNQETAAMAQTRIKLERDKKLAESDWTQLADISAEVKDLWAPYRQSLRDITNQLGYPFDVEWPQKPA